MLQKPNQILNKSYPPDFHIFSNHKMGPEQNDVLCKINVNIQFLYTINDPISSRKEGVSVKVSTNYFIQKSANCKSHGDPIL